MKASIIIPTYNEENYISQCLESLIKQDFKDFEIIIVDDGSTDKTREIVNDLIKKDKRIKLIKGEHKGPGISRNLGAKHSKSKVLVFVDADMYFPKNFIGDLISPILKGKEIGTQDGFQLALNPNNIWSKCWGFFQVSKEEYEKSHDTDPEARKGFIFRAILKSEFNKMGCFDPSLGYADDQTFHIKYGLFSYRVKKAFCYHKNPSTLKEVYKQSRWIGASINHPLLKIPALKYAMPLAMILLSPLAIPFLSIKRCAQNKNFKILFPWMLIFMVARYFGTIKGISNKLYMNKNVR